MPMLPTLCIKLDLSDNFSVKDEKISIISHFFHQIKFKQMQTIP